jgi:hypothetical protein
MPVYPAWVSFVDCRGWRDRMLWWVSAANQSDANGQAQAIFDDTVSLSNANAQSAGGVLGLSNLAVQYGSTATYSSIVDRCVFVWQDHVGLLHRFELPAPSAGIFLADGETLDPVDGAVATMRAAWLANGACGRSGALLEQLVGGRRVRRRSRRTLDAFTKSPSLVIPA